MRIGDYLQRITNGSAQTAWAAATSQTGQLADMAANWSGNVEIRGYSLGGTLLITLTYSGWNTDTSGNPYFLELGTFVSESFSSEGAVRYCKAFIPGGAEILAWDISPVSSGKLKEVSVSGLVILATASLPATDLPTWLSSVPVGQIVEISGTSPASYTDAVNGFTSDSLILNAYSGFHIASDATVRLFGGGHTDYSGNEVLDVDLTADAPAIATFSAPTPSGSRVAGGVWQGTAPNAKMNSSHTFDYAIWSPDLGRSLWLGQSSPWDAAGGVSGSDRTFSLIEATGLWAQPGSGDDLGSCPGGISSARDSAGNIYTTGGQHIYKYTVGSGWSDWVNNGALNWNGFGALVYDSTRDKLLRIGDLGTPRYYTIACSDGTVTDVSGSLSGVAGDLSLLDARTQIDTTGAAYDVANDRYVVPTGNGNEFLLINAGTWAVTKTSPTPVAGAVPNCSGYPTTGVWGRVKYVPALGGVAYWPTGASNLWFWRTS